MTARVGAARKNVLIQPARTEVSTIASAPRIKPRRQAVSLVLSDIIGSIAIECPYPLTGRDEGAIGKLKVNAEPLPTSLSTQILPPCSSSNFCAKVNLSSVPSLFQR